MGSGELFVTLNKDFSTCLFPLTAEDEPVTATVQVDEPQDADQYPTDEPTVVPVKKRKRVVEMQAEGSTSVGSPPLRQRLSAETEQLQAALQSQLPARKMSRKEKRKIKDQNKAD